MERGLATVSSGCDVIWDPPKSMLQAWEVKGSPKDIEQPKENNTSIPNAERAKTLPGTPLPLEKY